MARYCRTRISWGERSDDDLPNPDELGTPSRSLLLKPEGEQDFLIEPAKLYTLMKFNVKGTSFLLLDVRPSTDYETCKIDDDRSINIPEDILKPGVTWKQIQSYVLSERIWMDWSNWDMLILLDQASLSFEQSIPLSRLKEAIQRWERSGGKKFKGKRKLCLLKGGLANFMQYYPTCVSNAQQTRHLTDRAVQKGSNKRYDVLTTKTDVPAAKTIRQSSRWQVKAAADYSEANYNDSTGFDDDLADITLSIDKNEIRCHKFVLCMGSNVFRRMFGADMKEKSGKVVIEDVDLIDLKYLLIFMYTDTIAEDKITGTLLAAANKYEVLGLKDICAKKLVQKLELGNVAELWHIAYLHDAEDLAEHAATFMAANWEQVQNMESFEELVRERPIIKEKIASIHWDYIKYLKGNDTGRLYVEMQCSKNSSPKLLYPYDVDVDGCC